MDDDGLTIAELRPMGGTWSGLLFDNPAVYLAPALTWTFTFEFAEVVRSYGRSRPNLCLDWVPLPVAGWSDMAGRRTSCPKFAQPIESSIYFFNHHRYDTTELQVVRQAGRTLHVVAEVDGDIDALGIAALRASSRLLFDGITVALSHPPADVEAARAMLDDFTDTTGLEGFPRSEAFWFAPIDHT